MEHIAHIVHGTELIAAPNSGYYTPMTVNGPGSLIIRRTPDREGNLLTWSGCNGERIQVAPHHGAIITGVRKAFYLVRERGVDSSQYKEVFVAVRVPVKALDAYNYVVRVGDVRYVVPLGLGDLRDAGTYRVLPPGPARRDDKPVCFPTLKAVVDRG